MKSFDRIISVLSILMIIWPIIIRTENQIYQTVSIALGFSILVLVLTYSKIKDVEKNNENNSSKINNVSFKLKEVDKEIKINEKLADYDGRLKNLERRKTK